jgi:hypothetical protein
MLIAGDPKKRTLRAISNKMGVRYDKSALVRPSRASDERAFDRAGPAKAE